MIMDALVTQFNQISHPCTVRTENNSSIAYLHVNSQPSKAQLWSNLPYTSGGKYCITKVHGGAQATCSPTLSSMCVPQVSKGSKQSLDTKPKVSGTDLNHSVFNRKFVTMHSNEDHQQQQPGGLPIDLLEPQKMHASPNRKKG